MSDIRDEIKQSQQHFDKEVILQKNALEKNMEDKTGKSEQNVTKEDDDDDVPLQSRVDKLKKNRQNDPIVDPELLKDIDKSIGTDLTMSPLPSEQSENIPATNATTKSVSATHNTTDKESRDESKQEEVQPKVQSNPVKNSLGQKKPKDDSRITTLKDKMQEIHLDIERNPKYV
ncbi:uncharacterized protein LOC110718845 isoform X3 [Chenopodium quinoa]|uniref:uncharacterized protein LOC110718845 isoform X3 n=1 Tax=Chenopodium quinoa TaxID=63459 RepID=UPI000B791522|nr:uncharacterized protein LOC110718845 isoform X3 [Chenopodium quinoa]